METYEEESVIRGHHIYKRIWTPRIGEQLTTEIDHNNLCDRYAVAVTKDDKIVGHVPRELARISYHYISHGGEITCEVTGKRKFGKGLEVPCVYRYSGSSRLIKKLKATLKKKSTDDD